MAESEEMQDFGLFGMGRSEIRRRFVLGVIFILMAVIGYLETLRWQSQKNLIDQIESKNREIVNCKVEILEIERKHGQEIERILVEQARAAAKVVSVTKKRR